MITIVIVTPTGKGSATDTSTKSFWNLAKPFFSNKGCNKEEKSFLFENESIITDDTKVNITRSLPIIPGSDLDILRS